MGKDGSVMVERLVKKTSFSRSFLLRSTDGKCCLFVDFDLCFFVDFFKPGPRCRNWCHRTKIQWNVMGTSPRWIGTENKYNTITTQRRYFVFGGWEKFISFVQETFSGFPPPEFRAHWRYHPWQNLQLFQHRFLSSSSRVVKMSNPLQGPKSSI